MIVLDSFAVLAFLDIDVHPLPGSNGTIWQPS